MVAILGDSDALGSMKYRDRIYGPVELNFERHCFSKRRQPPSKRLEVEAIA